MSAALRSTTGFCMSRARIEREKGNLRSTCKWVRIGGFFNTASMRTRRYGL